MLRRLELTECSRPAHKDDPQYDLLDQSEKPGSKAHLTLYCILKTVARKVGCSRVWRTETGPTAWYNAADVHATRPPGILAMCGRFTLRTNPHEFAGILDVLGNLSDDFGPRYNVAPTQVVLCVRDSDQREFFQAKWGLIPSWSKDAKIGSSCINARSETVDTKPAFRSAFKKRRCLVLADGFYEWRKSDKQPYYISLKSGPTLFAGLWERWKSPDGPVESCTICTTEANEFMSALHDRMPVILPRSFVDHWLDPNVNDPAELKPLLAQYPSEDMQAWPVSKSVGNVRNQGPSLVEPVTAV
ncbi:MAG: SOS response-associated peptidase [Pirellulales bacterium]